jgi:quercetin dioxygenase-like cupin family protein
LAVQEQQGGGDVFAVECSELELMEAWSEADATLRGRFDFPISVETGAASTAVVYFELQPGDHCGRHTHSAEEILLILRGRAEAEVDGETAVLGEGGLGLVPARAPHDVRNVGSEPLRVVGFFSSAAVVTEFEQRLAPMGDEVLVIGAPSPQEPPVTTVAAPTG